VVFTVIGIGILAVGGFWLFGGVFLRMVGAFFAFAGVISLIAFGSFVALFMAVLGFSMWLAGHWHFAFRHHAYKSPLAQRIFLQVLPPRYDPTRDWGEPVLSSEPRREEVGIGPPGGAGSPIPPPPPPSSTESGATFTGVHFVAFAAFAAPVSMDEVMAAASEIAAHLDARVHGPDSVGNGKLISIWPPTSEPSFVSISARPLREGVVWVRGGSQGIGGGMFTHTDEIESALQARLGAVDKVRPPERAEDYDRGETQRLERETHELLEALAANPSSWDTLAAEIYLREVKLQYMTALG
jgi:hypothetical protein